MFTSKNPNFKKIYVKVNARITKAVPTLNAYKKTTVNFHQRQVADIQITNHL